MTVQTHVAIAYGAFIQTVFDFSIIAFAIFLAIKTMNSFQEKAEKDPKQAPKPSEDIVLLREIRDSLAKPKTAKKKK